MLYTGLYLNLAIVTTALFWPQNHTKDGLSRGVKVYLTIDTRSM